MQKVHLERVGSTMDAGRSWIDALYNEKSGSNTTPTITTVPAVGAIVYADAQDSGRGSKGRHWDSSVVGNVYVTYVIPLSSVALDKVTLLPAIVALSVLKATESFLPSQRSLLLRIKWPNDVLDSAGRKLSGTIVETHRGYLLVGVGVNVVGVAPGAAADGGRTPCSLKDLVGSSPLPTAEEVIDRIYDGYLAPYLRMLSGDLEEPVREKNGEAIVEEWSRYVDWTAPVVLREDISRIEWTPVRVTKDGFLCVRHPLTGELRTLIDSYLE